MCTTPLGNAVDRAPIRPVEPALVLRRLGSEVASSSVSETRRGVRLENLVHRPGQLEPAGAVQLDGRHVVAGHFEIHATQAGRAKTLQGLQDERPAQPLAAMGRAYADVLHRAAPA